MRADGYIVSVDLRCNKELSGKMAIAEFSPKVPELTSSGKLARFSISDMISLLLRRKTLLSPARQLLVTSGM